MSISKNQFDINRPDIQTSISLSGVGKIKVFLLRFAVMVFHWTDAKQKKLAARKKVLDQRKQELKTKGKDA